MRQCLGQPSELRELDVLHCSWLAEGGVQRWADGGIRRQEVLGAVRDGGQRRRRWGAADGHGAEEEGTWGTLRNWARALIRVARNA